MPSYLHRDESYMRLALEQAQIAAQLGEIPVGAVVVKDDQVIGRGYNRREVDSSAIAHAEVLAIEEACKALGTWRLTDCDLYVTLEPCPMCAGAIINARIRRVVYGVKDEKAGCCGSVADFFVMPFNHNPLCRSGILAQECRALLTNFFAQLRKD
ncbi:MAG: tRNA adenosine(34) deaminase TadA [Oscillospiraceae bacterium]|nr:tRNA adenosine(34) deaminase TadA [Oscillospiraceae bacterium]